MDYVGSSNKIFRRFQSHKSHIIQARKNGVQSTISGVAAHFSSKEHQDDDLDPIQNLRVTLVAKSESFSDLRTLENEFIAKLQTIKNGLNRLNPVRKAKRGSSNTANTETEFGTNVLRKTSTEVEQKRSSRS
jgi:hypothetical protein